MVCSLGSWIVVVVGDDSGCGAAAVAEAYYSMGVVGFYADDE